MLAVVSTPRNGIYCAVFYYTHDAGGTDYKKPIITIPCTDYDHARAVVEAFNKGL